MREEDLKRLIKGANQLRNIKLFAKPSSGGKVKLWVYSNYERQTLRLPAMQINSKTLPEEIALVKRAIDMRDSMEADEGDSAMSKADRKRPVSAVMAEWIGGYAFKNSKDNARKAMGKLLEACGEIAVGDVGRKSLTKTLDFMKKENYHANYIRTILSRLRSFCNWAEQRGYMGRVDTRKLLPPEQFGEVKALSDEELRKLAAAPCECPDVKDLFLLGVYTAQRMGEIKEYTFSMLYGGKIRARQGKTGKFIVIPLSEAALGVMRRLKERREGEGRNTGEKDKMFNLPASTQVYRHFKDWLEAAGLSRDRITPYNSRSTAISLLINKGVPESVTQELANHADPRITARYYRQIDDARKKEALDLIPAFL
jgi:integrase